VIFEDMRGGVPRSLTKVTMRLIQELRSLKAAQGRQKPAR